MVLITDHFLSACEARIYMTDLLFMFYEHFVQMSFTFQYETVKANILRFLVEYCDQQVNRSIGQYLKPVKVYFILFYFVIVVIVSIMFNWVCIFIAIMTLKMKLGGVSNHFEKNKRILVMLISTYFWAFIFLEKLTNCCAI